MLAFAILGIVGSGVYLIANYEALLTHPARESHSPHGSATRAMRPVQPPFQLDNAIIPRERIQSGGPPKDGIPSLTDAKYVTENNAQFMHASDKIIGVTFGGKARAYPLKILDYHEAVNDEVGGVSLVATYCPLCDSSAVYDRRQKDRILEFGISGLLFNSNVLLYDRGGVAGESLWSQMMSRSVAGSAVTQKLKKLPLEVTTWGEWQARFPQTSVLSTDTGHRRQYERRVYQSYFDSDDLMFPVEPIDDRLPKKVPVVGVSVEDTHRAYPLSSFNESTRISQELAGKRFDVVYDDRSQSLRIENAVPGVEWMYAFWFAWSAFHPAGDVYGMP